MATTTDDGFHEIQLNGKQLVFLFMAVTVVSVVIFLCGVLVGRGVRPQPSAAEALVAQQTPPAAPEPAAASATSSAPSATTKENLTYPDRLANAGATEEKLRKTPPPAPATPPRPVPSTQSVPAAQTAPSSSAAAEPAGPGFAIQLAALGKRDEADGLARRLTGKGYPAYVMAPSAGGPAVFRVRVGKFKDLREAESVKARLAKEEQFNPWIVR
jgi:cell division septation protein DedD